jgi:hypothetical protein
MLKTGSGTVLIDYYRDGDHYGVQVLSPTGVTAREAMADPGTKDHEPLKALYDLVFKKYHRLDDTLTNLLREIEQPGHLGEQPDEDDDLPF